MIFIAVQLILSPRLFFDASACTHWTPPLRKFTVFEINSPPGQQPFNRARWVSVPMNHTRPGIRFIALLEATKGVVVLVAGFGVLGVIHSGAQHVLEELARHFHLDPASRFPRIFLQLASHTNDSTLWLLAGAAVSYSGLRFIEAFGLWRGRRWAEWFGTITGAAYIPMEVYELFHGITWPKMTLLCVNVLCVVFLVRGLQENKVFKRHVSG